jgi:hypothetical protein
MRIETQGAASPHRKAMKRNPMNRPVIRGVDRLSAAGIRRVFE